MVGVRVTVRVTARLKVRIRVEVEVKVRVKVWQCWADGRTDVARTDNAGYPGMSGRIRIRIRSRLGLSHAVTVFKKTQ